MGNRNCMIGFPNRIDTAALSGGSWLVARPLSKLLNRRLGDVARSTNLAATSTTFVIDLGKPTNIRVIDIRNHNLSLTGKYRIRASAAAPPANPATAATYSYDSGWLDAWPVIYPIEALEWEDDNWWSGKYSDEQRAGYVAAATHVLAANKLARYWRIDFDDPLNSEGFLQVGRVFIGPAWQAQNNMSFGASIGWETTTEVQEAYSGSEYFDVKTPFRVARFALNWMTEDEGMSNAFELQRQAGVDKEVMWIHDPEDTTHALRRRFLGRLRQLSPVEFPYTNVTTNAFEIKELL